MKDYGDGQLATFRSQVSQNNRTKEMILSDKLLIKFLRSRNGDVAESMAALTSYIDMIQKRPDVFSWTDDIRKVINSGCYVQYPEKTPAGHTICLVSPSKWNPSDYPYFTYIRYVVFAIEMALLDEEVQKSGMIVICDMSGIRWTHIYNTGVSDAKLFSDLTERVLPRKLVGLHLVNANRFQDGALMLFRPFMTPTTKKVMHFHGKDYTKLHSIVPPELLPATMGGTAKEYPTSSYVQMLEKHKDEIIQIWDQLRISK